MTEALTELTALTAKTRREHRWQVGAQMLSMAMTQMAAMAMIRRPTMRQAAHLVMSSSEWSRTASRFAMMMVKMVQLMVPRLAHVVPAT